jgi:hypothetical protein
MITVNKLINLKWIKFPCMALLDGVKEVLLQLCKFFGILETYLLPGHPTLSFCQASGLENFH